MMAWGQRLVGVFFAAAIALNACAKDDGLVSEPAAHVAELIANKHLNAARLELNRLGRPPRMVAAYVSSAILTAETLAAAEMAFDELTDPNMLTEPARQRLQTLRYASVKRGIVANELFRARGILDKARLLTNQHDKLIYERYEGLLTLGEFQELVAAGKYDQAAELLKRTSYLDVRTLAAMRAQVSAAFRHMATSGDQCGQIEKKPRAKLACLTLAGAKWHSWAQLTGAAIPGEVERNREIRVLALNGR